MLSLLNQLKKALAAALPGDKAQYLMAPTNRQRVAADQAQAANYRPSAVMLLFCQDENKNIFIPLIERMAYSGHHSGQISLPGGKFDSEDGTLKNTALRECREEIGINDIEVLGPLSPLHIPISSFTVQPFVGFCTVKDPAMAIHVREVKSIVRLYLNDLLNETTVVEGNIEVNGIKIKTPYFKVESHKVWGATAMILSELKQMLKAVS